MTVLPPKELIKNVFRDGDEFSQIVIPIEQSEIGNKSTLRPLQMVKPVYNPIPFSMVNNIQQDELMPFFFTSENKGYQPQEIEIKKESFIEMKIPQVLL